MEVSVDFADGRIREFSTGSFTAPDPFRQRNPKDLSEEALLTEFDLRLDLLQTEGLRLDVYSNAISRGRQGEIRVVEELGHDGEPSTAQVAARHLYASVYLLSLAELASATYVLVRRCGQPVAAAWRQGSGGWLVDGQAFARLAREVYTDAQVVSTNSQAVRMVGYLSRANPGAGREDLIAMTGFPVEAFEELEGQELAAGEGGFEGDAPEPEGIVGADGDWGDGDG